MKNENQNTISSKNIPPLEGFPVTVTDKEKLIQKNKQDKNLAERSFHEGLADNSNTEANKENNS